MKKIIKDSKGQAIVEYILLLGAVISIYLIVARGLESSGITVSLVKPIKQDFARAYQYGHPKTKGFDDPGGPQLHIRADSDGNFRLFLNPREVR